MQCRTERAPDPTRILARLPRRVPGLSRRIYRRLVKRVALHEQTTSLIIRNGSGGSVPSFKIGIKKPHFPHEVADIADGKKELVEMGGGTGRRAQPQTAQRGAEPHKN